MKNKKSFFVILVVLLLGLLGWWLWRKVAPATAPLSAMSLSLKTSAGTPAGTPSAMAAATGTISPTIGQPTLNPTIGQMEVKINPALPSSAKFQMILDAQNGQTINAYGRVVDQYGVPIVDADVTGGTVMMAPDGTASREFTTTTDNQGQFNFLGLHGSYFGVGFKKIGYEFNPKLYLTWWNGYKPDPANPMVFTMYKLQGAEPMVHTKFGRTIPCDGTEVQYNLFTGKETTAGGGLVVTFSRNPIQIVRGTPFEWTLTLQVPGGGLAEINDPYPYEAPEGGYKESITIGTGPNPKTYTDSTTKNYYYKSADGKYGRLFITLQADFQPPPTSFEGSIYLNPSGSRNLEWDPEKQIKP